MMPAALAAIHHKPAQMTDSPTKSSNRHRGKLPPMHATTSEPVLPTHALAKDTSALRSPELMSPMVRAVSHERPRTPDAQSPMLEPGSAVTTRFGSIGRHSIAELLPHPGPLTNPLSNSLSAIVADSLRKGVDLAPGTMRRRSLRSKRSYFTQLAADGDGMDEIDHSPSKHAAGPSRLEQLGTSVSDNEGISPVAKLGGFLKKKMSRGGEDDAEH